MKPTSIQIETTAFCNASCSFCPHRCMKRQMGVMDMDLFKDIIDQSKEFEFEKVLLFLNGEPFMDPMMDERIDYVNKVLEGRVELMLYSNLAVPLKESTLERIKSCTLVVSIAENIHEPTLFDNLKKLQKVGIKIQVHSVALHTTIEKMRILKALFPDVIIHTEAFAFYNWAGRIKFPEQSTKPFVDGVCTRPATQICVLWNGDYALCCMDMENEVKLGNFKDMNLKEFWNSEIYTAYRTYPKSKFKFCKECNMEVIENE